MPALPIRSTSSYKTLTGEDFARSRPAGRALSNRGVYAELQSEPPPVYRLAVTCRPGGTTAPGSGLASSLVGSSEPRHDRARVVTILEEELHVGIGHVLYLVLAVCVPVRVVLIAVPEPAVHGLRAVSVAMRKSPQVAMKKSSLVAK